MLIVSGVAYKYTTQKSDRDPFSSIKICIVSVQIHGRVCTLYIAYCLEQQLVCIAVLTKVHTLYTM